MKFKFGNAFVFSPTITMGIVIVVLTVLAVGIMAALKVGPFASKSVPTSVPTLAARAVSAVNALATQMATPLATTLPTQGVALLSRQTVTPLNTSLVVTGGLVNNNMLPLSAMEFPSSP